jgi:pilus assembly protein Flp/PilA
MKNAILKFVRDEEGLTTVEYAVAGALIVVGSVAAFQLLGETVADMITQITDAMTGA